MSLFRWRWLRNFIRRSSKPIDLPTAELWKRRLSLGYAFLAWNAFGFVVYAVYQGKNDWALSYGYKTEDEAKISPAKQFAELLNIKQAKVIRISGLSKKEEYEVSKTEDEDKVEEKNS